MYLQRVVVRGFRAAADEEIVCELPGRFALLVGANNAGKSTLADALYLAHPHSRSRDQPLPRWPLPRLARSTSPTPSAPRRRRDRSDNCCKTWRCRPRTGLVKLERNLERVRAKTVGSEPEEFDALRLIYLPAYRNPLMRPMEAGAGTRGTWWSAGA